MPAASTNHLFERFVEDGVRAEAVGHQVVELIARETTTGSMMSYGVELELWSDSSGSNDNTSTGRQRMSYPVVNLHQLINVRPVVLLRDTITNRTNMSKLTTRASSGDHATRVLTSALTLSMSACPTAWMCALTALAAVDNARKVSTRSENKLPRQRLRPDEQVHRRPLCSPIGSSDGGTQLYSANMRARSA
jgi:hypothetical protein